MANILVIDDDVDLRLFMQRILKQAGHQTRVAANGFQGLEIYHDDPVDLVITDIIMPEMDGIEVIADLMRSGSHVQVIAISGGGFTLGSHFVLKVASSFKVRFTLAKPFTTEKLLRTVDEALAFRAA